MAFQLATDEGFDNLPACIAKILNLPDVHHCKVRVTETEVVVIDIPQRQYHVRVSLSACHGLSGLAVTLKLKTVSWPGSCQTGRHSDKQRAWAPEVYATPVVADDVSAVN